MALSRLSLDVIGAPRPPKQGGEAPSRVLLSEPMRRYRCNQKGCCCSGWEIPFQLEDFLRLHEHLPPAEREELTHGIQLVIDAQEKGENGEAVLHSLKLDGVGEERACRFLEPSGGCRVHARVGLQALPDLCVDFPAFPFRREDGAVELWFDPVCPEVIERFDEQGPLALVSHEGPLGEPGLDLRVTHAADPIAGRVGKHRLSLPALDALRQTCQQALAGEGALWRILARLLDAFARLDPELPDGGGFELRDEVDPQPFIGFLAQSIGAHGPDLLAATVARYRRFIWALDVGPLLERRAAFEEHLTQWQPAYAQWLAPEEEALRPLMARFLAHRFGTPMTKARAELRQAADEIVHVYATSLRFAAAMGATLERPVDRAIYKAALGSAEFFFRSLHLPRPALPWLASADRP